MKILGLLIALLGWFIAILSVDVPSTTGQILVALAGFCVVFIGVVGVLNGAHLKSAIWKG